MGIEEGQGQGWVKPKAGAKAFSCFWLAEKEGEEAEEQALTPQEEELEILAQPEQEPSERLEGSGCLMTLKEGCGPHQDFKHLVLVIVSTLQKIPYAVLVALIRVQLLGKEGWQKRWL